MAASIPSILPLTHRMEAAEVAIYKLVQRLFGDGVPGCASDHGRRSCYDCCSPFSWLHRCHCCCICGRIFCSRCIFTLPSPSSLGFSEKSSACKFCCNLREFNLTMAKERESCSPSLTPSSSSRSLFTNGSSISSSSSSCSSGFNALDGGKHGISLLRTRGMNSASLLPKDKESSPSPYDFCSNRSNDGDDFGHYHVRNDDHDEENNGSIEIKLGNNSQDDFSKYIEHHQAKENGSKNNRGGFKAANVDNSLHGNLHRAEDKISRSSRTSDSFEGSEEVLEDGCKFYTPLYQEQNIYQEIPSETGKPFDLQNNALIWVVPPPEDEEDETEIRMVNYYYDDDDDDDYEGLPQSSDSLSIHELRSREKVTSIEERKALRAVVDGHFRALVAQLLVESLSTADGNVYNWLDIVTSLSWQAANLVKPDTRKGGGMDPGGYVKVKCIESGLCSDSYVARGVVCKGNVIHRRMTSRYKKPRLLLLGCALECQPISNQLSSIGIILQQERDYLSTAVARIEAHHPNVVLVEKTVSSYARDRLLAKEISLVLNVKRSLLERIARCTGAQIVPSLDDLFQAKVGHCEIFHVEKCLEEHADVGQSSRKILKHLMYFEDCPKPLGCTILLKGSNDSELKKVKCVVQLAVFAAYHLALETSFLADEGAALPDPILKSPISIPVPGQQHKLERSISRIPSFSVATGKTDTISPTTFSNSPLLPNILISYKDSNPKSPQLSVPFSESIGLDKINPDLSELFLERERPGLSLGNQGPDDLSVSLTNAESLSAPYMNMMPEKQLGQDNPVFLFPENPPDENLSISNNSLFCDEILGLSDIESGQADLDSILVQESQLALQAEDQGNLQSEDKEFSQEDFPPSPSDHQSILVSYSSNCPVKGVSCERGRLLRIKYYGSFDKPLGRFLRDDLFDRNKRCDFCEELVDDHIYCYTHHQGSLTICLKHQNQVLAGGREGKIWMWHCCLKCFWANGSPPVTRRVVMSDAAWGLSFGKFLELSFSNHAAARRVAACGHSLHRDCLRFYGFGSMVACFRYAPISVHSVYLPPAKLLFNIPGQQEWLRNETLEVIDQGNAVFAEAVDSICQVGERIISNGCRKILEATRHISELEALLERERIGFQEAIEKAALMESQPGQPIVDILKLNHIRRVLATYSAQWDKRLQNFVSTIKISKGNTCSEYSLLGNSQNLFSKDAIPESNNGDSAHSQGFLDNEPNGSKSISVYDIDMAVSEDCMQIFSEDNSSSSLTIVTDQLSPGVVSITGDSSSVSKDHVIDAAVDVKFCLLENDAFPMKEKPLHINCQERDIFLPESDSTLYSGILKDDTRVRSAISDKQFSSLSDIAHAFEVAWTGNSQYPEARTVHLPQKLSPSVDRSRNDSMIGSFILNEIFRDDCVNSVLANSTFVQEGGATDSNMNSVNSFLPNSTSEDVGRSARNSFASLYRSYSSQSSLPGSPRSAGSDWLPRSFSINSFLAQRVGAAPRVTLPLGIDNTVIAIYDDEPTSIIAYALVSCDYKIQLSSKLADTNRGGENDKKVDTKEKERLGTSSCQSSMIHPLQAVETSFERAETPRVRSDNSSERPLLMSKGFLSRGPSLQSRSAHIKVSISDSSPQGRVKYTVACYCAKQFDALRKKCCPSEMEFIRSLCRSKRWGAQGGKSSVYFAKTADDRLVIKQLTKTELDSFLEFAPEYFKYLSDALVSGSPTCLAKILGIFQITRHVKGGKDARMDLMIMENLLYGHHVKQLYDLKGSVRSRYNADKTGKDKVLLDQNLLESMQTNPIFVSGKAKRLLERAIWNDTAFLASVDVMDYSLLVGVDDEQGELVIGIIDFVRQYTWDKHLETWVKASGILGGPKNAAPTVISPLQYKKRFRKAMNTYFLMVPDQWLPSTVISLPDVADETMVGPHVEMTNLEK